MKDGGDGEGAVRFETRGMCLKFWCQLPVRVIWHPIKPQVRGAANRAPQNKVPKFQTLGRVFEVKGGLTVPIARLRAGSDLQRRYASLRLSEKLEPEWTAARTPCATMADGHRTGTGHAFLPWQETSPIRRRPCF